MTKHRYAFDCGHNANATNEDALRIISIDGQKHRFCPKCHLRVRAALQRCIDGRARKAEPLPELEG